MLIFIDENFNNKEGKIKIKTKSQYLNIDKKTYQ